MSGDATASHRASGARLAHPAVVLTVATACLATLGTSPPPPTLPAYPSWEITDRRAECHHDVEIATWFAKSGKEGAGLVVRFDNTTDNPRRIAVNEATMRIRHTDAPHDDASITVDATTLETVEVDDRSSAYVPFVFDNNDAWNQELRAATVDLELTIDDTPTSLTYRAEQRRVPWTETYQRGDDRLIHAPDSPGEYNIRLDDIPGGCP